ncbi:MAG: hypothetical protein KAT65_28815, partial [Methanophagales archaeon]|nr:hypothetical protein [Methanophagales archaeon]
PEYNPQVYKGWNGKRGKSKSSIVRSVVFYGGFIRTTFGSIGVKLFLSEAPFIAYQSQPCKGSHEPVSKLFSHCYRNCQLQLKNLFILPKKV